MPLVKDLADSEKVPQRLGHLLLVDLHEPIVDPIPSEFLARRSARLGDFVFVVREDKIHASAMDVERFTQVVDRHGRTLDVPARAAGTPRTRPRWFTGLGGLPQRKVHGVALPIIHFDARPGQEVLRLSFRQTAIGWIGLYLIIDITIQSVRVPLRNQRLNHCNDVRDMLCSLWFDIGLNNSEAPHVLLVGDKILLCNFCRGFPFLRGAVDDLIVDVRKVSHVLHSVPAEPQVVPYDIKDERATRMAQVRIIVDRHSACIHPDSLRFQRLEDFLPAGQRVEDLQHASVFHAKAPMKGTKTQSPKSLRVKCPCCFTPNCRRCTVRSPTGMTSRPPSRNCSTSNGGTLGDPAATRMASNGPASPQP